MYVAGHTYGEILRTLKDHGYKTKIRRDFGKNSLYEILKNEKYTGVYIFNKSASKNIRGTFNRHTYKDEKDIIRVEDGIPAIVDNELFMEVRKRMEVKMRSRASYKAKNTYMLTGLVICAECGGLMTGETRRYRKKEYGYYVCNNQKRNNSCSCKPVSKDKLEETVVQNISEKIFNKRNVRSICTRIHESYKRSGISSEMNSYEQEIRGYNTKIANLYRAIENGLNPEETTKRINMLTKQKNVLEFKLIELNSIPEPRNKTVDELVEEFSSRADLRSLSKNGQKKIIQQIVEKIFLYDSKKIRLIINPNGPNADFWDTNGGEGGI
ncbi:MAG TPA: hypothetical protein DHN33_03030 [Eubacteriaceae bacterium]|nr:hypothetical protein [Eubacteriaceae bacterium]